MSITTYNEAHIMTYLSLVPITTPLSQEEYNNHFSKYYKDQHVLVTGGAGFIGSHLVEKLVEAGAVVTVLDDFSSGLEENLAEVKDRITIIPGCITCPDTCLSAAQGKKFVFHLAAFTSVAASLEDPSRCHMVNVAGTAHILEAARRTAVSTFVFASSAAVYGNTTYRCHERATPEPTSPYGFSKFLAELYTAYYSKSYGIKTISCRYFNVYGPRQNLQAHNAGVVAQFTRALQENLPVVMYGDGRQRRDFISVQSTVNATLLVALLPFQLVGGQTINVATGASVSINELFHYLRQQFPAYNKPPLYQSARQGDIRLSEADCSTYLHLAKLSRTIL
jgi:nucleoside-diphosphate-sugar epimerase